MEKEIEWYNFFINCFDLNAITYVGTLNKFLIINAVNNKRFKKDLIFLTFYQKLYNRFRTSYSITN